MKVLTISDDAYSVICGLVQPSSVIDIDDVVPEQTETWQELRSVFPFAGYRGAEPDWINEDS